MLASVLSVVIKNIKDHNPAYNPSLQTIINSQSIAIQVIFQACIYLKYYKCYLGFTGNHISLIFLSKVTLPFQS